MSIYVGNLNYSTTDEDIHRHFSAFGTVKSSKIITDRETGHSKGFAFVEMETEEMNQAAIEATNGKEFMGRTLRVNISRPREERPPRRGGGGGGYGRRDG